MLRSITPRCLKFQVSFLKYIISKNHQIEIRILNQGQTYYGYFDEFKSALKALYNKSPRSKIPYGDYPRDGESEGIYYTLNIFNPALKARSLNKITRGRVGSTTSDQDVTAYSFILVDADPVRPSGISSSKEEKREAARVIKKVVRFLNGLGIEGYLADSGNGFHFLIPVSIPIMQTAGASVRNFLQHLKEMFSTSKVSIDTTVANPARISKLYGTMVRKGSDTPDRPHRRSAIHFRGDLPDQDLLGKIAAPVSPSVTPAMTTITTNGNDHISILQSVLDAGAQKYRRKDKADRVIFEFEDCPVHTDNDGHHYECSVFIDDQGKYCGHCFHDEEKGWQDFKQAIRFDELKPVAPPLTEKDLEGLVIDTTPPIIVPGKVLSTENPETVKKNIHSYREKFRQNRPLEVTQSLIPGAGFPKRKCVSTIGGNTGVGKSTLLSAGIIMPMLKGEPVLGRFMMPKIKTYYIQSDSDEAYFMNRIFTPYGYNFDEHSKWIEFFHVQNSAMPISIPNILVLIEDAIRDGFEWIIIDNKTTLFPGLCYDPKSANKDSLLWVDALKKIAVKYDIASTMVEHTTKKGASSQAKYEMITVDSILSTGTKLVEQVIGLNARYDVYKAAEKSPKEYIQRPGEGIIVPLKNVELVDMMQYSIFEDEKGKYLDFSPYTGICNNITEDERNAPAPQSCIMAVLSFIKTCKSDEFMLAEAAAATGFTLTMCRKVLFELSQSMRVVEKINEGNKGGRGHKALYRILNRDPIIEKNDLLLQEIPIDV